MDQVNTTLRYACIGHRIYFENHFIEGHDSNPNIKSFDFDHYSWRPFQQLISFAPDVTLIFRPELYPAELVRSIPGLRIGFSSEPLPTGNWRTWQTSSETSLRESLYEGRTFSDFHYFFHYDRLSQPWFKHYGIQVTDFRVLPIDTLVFRPKPSPKDIDFLFIGKATEYRLRVLDRFRTWPFRFVWVAHGVFGKSLADLIRRAHCVLNVHADGRIQSEPRVILSASCGTPVLSEPLDSNQFPLSELVCQRDFSTLDEAFFRRFLSASLHQSKKAPDLWHAVQSQLSARHLVDRCLEHFSQRGGIPWDQECLPTQAPLLTGQS